ncbi:hypothetical protein BJ165DRAFT_1478586 [Panaeolus papilionaceus]|nr:hypothetical protein BJ165DRAFT_1478586 [Panaeolus papilionaceus]
MINWRNKTIDVGGQRKKIAEVRRKVPGWVMKKGKTRLWRWGPDREEYLFEHEDEGWQITTTTTTPSTSNASPTSTPVPATTPAPTLAGLFTVPYRPKLFGPTKPVTLKLSRKALLNDEVFLILAVVYSEAKRGDKSNGSGTWGL